MNGRGGGCCIARYSGNGGGGQISYGMLKVDKIMLKFRPIAPKPMASGSGSSSSTVDPNVGNRRRKRKYVRVNGNKSKKETKTISKKRNMSSLSSSDSGGGNAVVTLSLMPETPDRKENSLEASSLDLLNRNKPQPIMLSFNNEQQKVSYGHVQGTKSHVHKSETASFVTMECVTDTWMVNGENGLGFVTDHARLMNLEMDTCPAFITDNKDTVVWTNKAYKEMTAGGGGDGSAAAEVVVKQCNRATMPVSQLGFTCKVKVTWGSERGRCESSVTAPCDVWRLRSGGYAWWLDVKAALCLGR